MTVKMQLPFNISFMGLGMAGLAILAGAGVVWAGDYLLGVDLELFFGIGTFRPLWIVDLFLVPFIAGIVVSMIFGLGGKILAHFSPLIVRITSYIQFNNAESLPDGVTLLPMGYWLLVLVVAIEFSALGGIVGEAVIKRTYGRTQEKSKLHKKYQKTEQTSTE